MTDTLFERHRETLEAAVTALRARTYWSAFAEVPSGRIYGETAKADGQAAFEARLNKPFELDQPGTVGRVGREVSPYGRGCRRPPDQQGLRGCPSREPQSTPKWVPCPAARRQPEVDRSAHAIGPLRLETGGPTQR